tara:strand:- start:163 stop:405 length:243 start_codon:yes stop_codon:yes gene_type:complete
MGSYAYGIISINAINTSIQLMTLVDGREYIIMTGFSGLTVLNVNDDSPGTGFETGVVVYKVGFLSAVSIIRVGSELSIEP